MARSRLNERLSILATIDPVSQTAGSVSSDVIDMSLHREVCFILLCGVLGSSATADLKLQTGTTNSPSTDLSGKAITQLTKASNDTGQATINLRSSEMPAGHRYVKAVAAVGTNTSLIGLVAVAENDRYEPATATQLSSVAQNLA